MIFSILFLFLANMAVADSCGVTSNAPPNKWKNIQTEKVVINGNIVELYVIKKEPSTTSSTGEIVTFTKFNEDHSIFIDSIIYSDSTIHVLGTAVFPAEGISIEWEKSRTGIDEYRIEKNHEIIEMYAIGLKKEEIYDTDGNLASKYREIRGDTVFINCDYMKKLYMKKTFPEFITDSGIVVKRYLN